MELRIAFSDGSEPVRYVVRHSTLTDDKSYLEVVHNITRNKFFSLSKEGPTINTDNISRIDKVG